MRVIALPCINKKYVGYYALVRRKAGDVFDLTSPAHFSSKWMKQVDTVTPKTPAPGEPTPEEMRELSGQQDADDTQKDGYMKPSWPKLPVNRAGRPRKDI